MKRRNVKKRIPLTDYQKQYITDNHNKLSSVQIANDLKLSQMTTWRRMVDLGFKKPKAKVVRMEGYFDIEKFGKLYAY